MVLKLIDRVLFFLYFRQHYKRKFKRYGDGIRWGKHFAYYCIPRSIRISCPQKIAIGDNCQIDEGVYLQCHHQGEGIILGNGSRINAHTHLLSFDLIELKEKVLVAPFCLIASGNHGKSDGNAAIMDCPHRAAGKITIGSGSWLGHGVKILGGVHLGPYSTVSASAVVLKGEYPDQAILCGNPAVLKQRKEKGT